MATTQAQTCPECEGTVRAGECETVCTSCGLVVNEHAIDPGPEWRSFDDDDTNPERTGAPLTRSRHDRGLSTEIGRSTRLKGRKRRRVARMRRQHKRTQIRSKAERNRVYAFTEIRRLVSRLELPEHVREQSCALFESLTLCGLEQGTGLLADVLGQLEPAHQPPDLGERVYAVALGLAADLRPLVLAAQPGDPAALTPLEPGRPADLRREPTVMARPRQRCPCPLRVGVVVVERPPLRPRVDRVLVDHQPAAGTDCLALARANGSLTLRTRLSLCRCHHVVVGPDPPCKRIRNRGRTPDPRGIYLPVTGG